MSNLENEFGKFFYSSQYIKLKNLLFNYRFRKYILRKKLCMYLKNPKKAKILDIGSGISPVSPFPENSLFVDIEREAISYLKNKGLKAKIGDITKLDLTNDSFDIILCSEVLEHIKEYEKAINELKRVLKKGGFVFITIPTHMYYWRDDDEFVGHYRRFDPHNLEIKMKNLGMKIIERLPIGSRVERNLTWFFVKLARKNEKRFSDYGFMKYFLFHFFNSMLFCLTWIFYKFNSEHNSSISLFILTK